MNFLRYACFAAMGAILSIGGITFRSWELYIVLVLAAVACEIRAAENK